MSTCKIALKIVHQPLTRLAVSRLLRMFIAANTRRPATTSRVFEFDFEMEFFEVLRSVKKAGFPRSGHIFDCPSENQPSSHF